MPRGQEPRHDPEEGILADPRHEEHEDRKEWLGGDFDPDAFDDAAVTRALRRL